MKNEKMNIIKVYNGQIVHMQLEEGVLSFKKMKDKKNQIYICIQKSCFLQIESDYDQEITTHFLFEIKPNIEVSITEIYEGKKANFSYDYKIDEKSHLFLQKIHKMEDIKSQTKVQLNGENAEITFLLKTICEKKETYETNVFHNAKNTKCILYHHGINRKDGSLSFSISNRVKKQMKNTLIRQNSQIITFNKKKCEIKPILLIDEDDVDASHSAHIGKFDFDQIFYLQSRGISETNAYSLLAKGFFKQKLMMEEKKLEQLFETYWR